MVFLSTLLEEDPSWNPLHPDSVYLEYVLKFMPDCLTSTFDISAIGHNLHNCRYDGQRAQIHKLVDGSVHVFSRNGDESTSRFPDLINIINQSCKPDAVTFILDAEVKAHALSHRDTHFRS